MYLFPGLGDWRGTARTSPGSGSGAAHRPIARGAWLSPGRQPADQYVLDKFSIKFYDFFMNFR